MLIPFFDRIHSTMLFWLAPSQQIRPPIYSFRQRSQRRKIVFKCEYYLIVLHCAETAVDSLQETAVLI